MKSDIQKRITKMYKKEDNSLIHGDLYFSNIFYDSTTKLFKLIDPRGKWGNGIGGDIKYDIAKIRHSIVGCFDIITNGLYTISYDKKNGIELSIFEPTNYQTLHTQIDNYLKGIDGILRLSFKSLSLENISKNGSDYPVVFSDKGREILDNISLILDRIQQLSFLVTYYKSNSTTMSKNIMIQADEDHKKCHNMYLKIIKKLTSIEKTNKSCGQAIELYLFKHQFVVNHLNYSI